MTHTDIESSSTGDGRTVTTEHSASSVGDDGPALPEGLNGPEGWYPDPQGLAPERYWDGSDWTERTRSTPGSTVPKATESEQSSGDGASLASMEYLHAITLVLLAGVVAAPFVIVGVAITFAGPDSVFPGALLIVLGVAIGIALCVASVGALMKADRYNKRASG